MYRFLLRPKWIGFHLLVAAAIVAMVNLGFWQLRRLDQRQAFNAVVEARYDAPPVSLDELVVPGVDPSDIEWRPVTASGTYLPDEEIEVVNRSQGGRAGFNTVVPLRLDDGRILLVNRGFEPLDAAVPPVPALDVTVTGRLRPSQQRRLGQLSDPADGDLAEVQRVDIGRLAPQLPGEVVPMYVDLIESDPAEPQPFPEPVMAPELGEGNHLSYAVQWFIFSAAAAVGWVLALRRSVASRRGAATATVGDGAGPGSHEPMANRPGRAPEQSGHDAGDVVGRGVDP
jgi:cytochrome oxidase assembly protein ShyY1